MGPVLLLPEVLELKRDPEALFPNAGDDPLQVVPLLPAHPGRVALSRGTDPSRWIPRQEVICSFLARSAVA